MNEHWVTSSVIQHLLHHASSTRCIGTPRDDARGPDDIRDPRAGGQVSEVDKFPAFLPTLTMPWSVRSGTRLPEHLPTPAPKQVAPPLQVELAFLAYMLSPSSPPPIEQVVLP